MKILTSLQMRQLDAYTMENERISSQGLMERASQGLTAEIENRWPQDTPVMVFAGPGNNGGDALCVARLLAEKDYTVGVWLFNTESGLSPDCQLCRDRLKTMAESRPTTLTLQEIKTSFQPPELKEEMLVIDGLFGTGLSRPLSGGFAAVVQYINASPATVLAIDVPSGLMTEDNSGNNLDNVIHADYTFTFQHPKLAFFFPEHETCVGDWQVVNIGLADPDSADDSTVFATPYEMTEEADVRRMLKPRSVFAHKGMLGHAALVAGKLGMAGAAVLAARACLRSGVGKLTVHTPEANRPILQVAVPEAILNAEHFSSLAYDALAMGPGIGTDEDANHAMIDLLQHYMPLPLVLDADALNLLADHPQWLPQLPENAILTPHRGELERLTGPYENSYDLLQKTLLFAHQNRVVVVMKGAFTVVVTPDGKAHFNTTGNAGMATAGTGDVLTGIIVSLLAQGYTPDEAARFGVYVHGLAGDYAADRQGQISLIASDIIDSLPQAFKQLTD
ncbi:MAG: NAD(P)H-hydrate dehydratase [Bacteroidaceae bacterium]|nr:NAD(P)H-hydrate dehydratase [Bacteroidaceae bacterium]